MTPERRAMVDYARSLVGAKWRHRGRKPWAVDCIGIVALSLEAAGATVEDRVDYGREPWREGLREGLRARFGEPISFDDAEPGDVILFAWPGKEPSHIGILADYTHGGLSVIHAMQRKNVAEHAIDGAWKRLAVEAYRTW